MKRLIATSVLVLLSACGNNAGITFDSSVPSEQARLLEQDINRLNEVQFVPASSNDLNSMGLSELSGPALTQWLGQRVRIIIGEDFPVSDRTYRVANPTPFTPVLFAEKRAFSPFAATTVALNRGADLYLKARNSNYSYFLDLDVGLTQIYSPRVGIMQIGEGLFTVQGFREAPINSFGNSLARNTTLVHEARHSDGNGDNVAFPHAQCPSWMDGYANEYACEGYINGPYAIQTAMMNYFRLSCTQCGQLELSGMDTSIADYRSRLLSGAVFQDIRPEALAEIKK